MKKTNAFSLVEVVISLGIVTFALIAIFGLLSVGLYQSKRAIDNTYTSLIVQDARFRAQALLETAAATTNSLLTTWWYDNQGRYLGTNYAAALYRVDVKVSNLPAASSILNTPPPPGQPNPNFPNILRAGQITIGSPVDTASGSGGKLLSATNVSSAVYPIFLRSPAPYLQ